jgi:hypothetical protein
MALVVPEASNSTVYRAKFGAVAALCAIACVIAFGAMPGGMPVRIPGLSVGDVIGDDSAPAPHVTAEDSTTAVETTMQAPLRTPTPPAPTRNGTAEPRRMGTNGIPEFNWLQSVGVMPPKDARVAAPDPRFVDPYVAGKAAPPVDIAVLMPFKLVAWELDYLLRDTLPYATNGGTMTIHDYDLPGWNPGRPKPSLQEVHTGGRKRIVVLFAHMHDSQPENCPRRFQSKIEYYRPSAIIIMSDEILVTKCVHQVLLDSRWTRTHPVQAALGFAPLMLRQYAREIGTVDPPDPRVHIIPLGYMPVPPLPRELERDMLIKASRREMMWTFVGWPKNDRKEIMANFAKWFPDGFAFFGGFDAAGSMTTTNMTRAYANAKFVISPWGNAHIECTRQYEASRVGAIPVLVVPEPRAIQAFATFLDVKTDGRNRTGKDTFPPWLFANSWREAADRMVAMAADPVALDAQQAAVLHWWNNFNYTFRLRVYEASVRHPDFKEQRGGVATAPDT